MRTSASAFAAQLADDMHRDLPGCEMGSVSGPDMIVRPESMCGFPAGRVAGLCTNGHASITRMCSSHAADAIGNSRCVPCCLAGKPDVPVAITTEVA